MLNELGDVRREDPRLEHRDALVIAGLRQYYTADTVKDIPLLWQRFAPYLNHIPQRVGRKAYGLVFSTTAGGSGVEYVAGVEVASVAGLPEYFSSVNVRAHRYAIFPHRGHVSQLKDTMSTISREWPPIAGIRLAPAAADTPDVIELYGEKFDSVSGTGDIEVWVPINDT